MSVQVGYLTVSRLPFLFQDIRRGELIGVIDHHLSASFVKAFCEATGQTEGIPEDSGVAPPGLLTLLSTAAFRERTGRRSGDVHARHVFDQISPLHVGETVTTTSHVVDKYTRRGRRYVVYSSTTTQAEGARLIARCLVTLLVAA